MTREEAIEALKAKMDYYESDKRLRAALETLIPELAESEDERIRKRLLWFLANYNGRWDYPETRMACRAWLEKQKEQKPAEWSEEDRLHYANVLEALEYVKGCKSDYDKIEAIKSDIAWFKSLRPVKQEWSEEEEKDMAHIIRILDDCYAYGRHDLSKTNHENLVNFLKSLRPSWKPSEEDEK